MSDKPVLVLAVGDRVEQMCVTCGEERGHIVASLTKTGRVTRVTCPMCGSRVAYKRGDGVTRQRASRADAPYDRQRTYRRGQSFMHPTFGEGQVTALIEPGKIDVLFADRMRRLIHSSIQPSP